jgi:hypothetical protein
MIIRIEANTIEELKNMTHTLIANNYKWTDAYYKPNNDSIITSYEMGLNFIIIIPENKIFYFDNKEGDFLKVIETNGLLFICSQMLWR